MECGAAVVSIIPVRGGNGEMERLRALGEFTPPTLSQLEAALDASLALGGSVVTADLWDVERLPGCGICRSRRIERLARLNLSGRAEPGVVCDACEVQTPRLAALARDDGGGSSRAKSRDLHYAPPARDDSEGGPVPV
jgi:hypothetical protein